MSIGTGYAGIELFAMNMGMQLFSEETYRNIMNLIHECSMDAVNNNLKNVRVLVESFHRNLPENKDFSHDKPIHTTVSFDGSWLTRGFASKFGIAVLVDVLTG